MPVNQAAHHNVVGVELFGWAGCVAVTGYFGERIGAWQCFERGYGFRSIPVPAPFGYYRAVIKSTNRSENVFLGGWWNCCQ